ncbi:MAG: RsbRD N-terminal domain-containing protein, partial [Desulfobacterales bacterium]
ANPALAGQRSHWALDGVLKPFLCQAPGAFMEHRLKGLIEKNKNEIIKNWFEATIQTYAPDTAQFYKGQKDPFANPVGNITAKGVEFLLDQLLNDFEPDAVQTYLDPIIRIRAVQDFTPSQATAFILLLKKVLRDCLSVKLQDAALVLELLAFESKIDQLCLMAFDIFMTCKEKIYQISANDMRSQALKAFKRAGLIADESPQPGKVKGLNH